jgi:hypothetical protein
LEVHDFSTPVSSNDKGGPGTGSPSDSSSKEDYPGYDPGRDILLSWPRVHCLASGSDPARDPWLSLPTASGGASWSLVLVGLCQRPISFVGHSVPLGSRAGWPCHFPAMPTRFRSVVAQWEIDNVVAWAARTSLNQRSKSCCKRTPGTKSRSNIRLSTLLQPSRDRTCPNVC